MLKKLCYLFYLFSAYFCFGQTELKISDSMLVKENLRLRNFPENGNVLTVLQADSCVKIIKLGTPAIIDGIKSNWVEIEVQRGAKDKNSEDVYYGITGWCFAGFLKKIEKNEEIPDYKGGNGTIISQTDDKKLKIERRKFELIVSYETDFAKSNSNNNSKVKQQKRNDVLYSSLESNEIIYELKINDLIKIKEMYFVTEKEKSFHYVWLFVEINSVSGYLLYSGASYNSYYDKIIDDYSYPYENNAMEIVEELSVCKSKWTIRKLNQFFSVFVPEDYIEIQDLPGTKNVKVIGKIPSSYKNGNSQINVRAHAITEEKSGNDYWIRVLYNGISGWVHGSCLSVERGGPKYYFPESVVLFSFMGQ